MTEQAQREQIERDVAAVLRAQFPEVQLYDVELRGGRSSAVTVFIERPDGVDLDLCAAVSAALMDLRETHALEVSSPGIERRLRRPGHFAAAVGQVLRLKTKQARGGRTAYRGRLVAASATTATVAVDDGELQIAYEDIARANVVYVGEHDGGRHE